MIKIDQVKGIGKKNSYHLRQQNIWSAYDLLLTYPKGYNIYFLKEVNALDHLQTITFKARITTSLSGFKKGRLHILSFFIEEESGIRFKVTIFNRQYLMHSIKKDDDIIVTGKVDYYERNIVANKIIKDEKHKEIIPFYNLKEVTDYTVNQALKNIMEENLVNVYDVVPTNIRQSFNLINRLKAFNYLHFPKREDEIKKAYKYFKVEEAYDFLSKIKREDTKRESIDFDLRKVRAYLDQIPYELTTDQKRAINEIFRDLNGEVVVNRLIQGDVGSGKTIVAFAGILGAFSAGSQSAVMAPTEILARQHYENFTNLFPNINVRLLLGSTKNKEEIKLDIATGDVSVVFGTQAIIQEDVIYKNLSLVVIDEQHKFGVVDRKKLITKDNSANVIYLTATPIPRTLSYTYYGDIKVSVIKEKPRGRIKVETILTNKDDSNMYKDLSDAINSNHKVFVVAPAIDSTLLDDNIETTYELLQEKLPNADIYKLHGRLKKQEQEQIISDFIEAASGILLATTMIEVGVDIKTATKMVIFDANRFGLSQIHQLRGRVGRSDIPSTCYLLSDKDNEKLKMLTFIDDGFELSRYDLKLRGPGDLLGVMQSGIPDFKFIDLSKDELIFEKLKEIL